MVFERRNAIIYYRLGAIRNTDIWEKPSIDVWCSVVVLATLIYSASWIRLWCATETSVTTRFGQLLESILLQRQRGSRNTKIAVSIGSSINKTWFVPKTLCPWSLISNFAIVLVQCESTDLKKSHTVHSVANQITCAPNWAGRIHSAFKKVGR